MNNLPNLICPGSMKSGTTTLFDVIKQHPEVYVPDKKELHFFTDDYEKGLEFYSEFFKGAGSQKYRIDITPYYMFPEAVPGRIFDCCGKDVKFIFCLRNPVDRAYSMYFMRRNMLYETKSFEKAIALEDKRLAYSNTFRRRYSYIGRGYYYEQIKRFLEYYPIENMYFLIFEDFTNNLENESKKLFRFLNIDENVKIDYEIWANRPMKYKHGKLLSFFKRIANGPLFPAYKVIKRALGQKTVRKIAGKMTEKEENNAYPKKNPKTCNLLMERYEDDIRRLEKLIDRDLSFWIKKYKS